MNFKKRVYGKTKEYTVEQLKELFSQDRLDYISFALLFGSRVESKYHTQSDYDFAIYPKDIKYDSWGIDAKLYNDIGDVLDLPEYDYDIINLKTVKSNILNSIKGKYIMLKGEDNEFQRLFNRNK